MIRRLLPLVGVLLAISSTAARAETPTITWWCGDSTGQWPMKQPRSDYDAGLYPAWTDCEAWRNGDPGPEYVWSYGPTPTSTSTSTTSSEPSTTSTNPPPSTEPPPTTAPYAPTTTATTTTTNAVTSTTVNTMSSSFTTYPQSSLPTTSSSQNTPTTVDKPTITSQTSTSSSLPGRSIEPTITPPTPPNADLDAVLAADLTRITPAEAADLFAGIDETQLSGTESAQLVAAVQTAPIPIREAFEQSVNIFAGGTEDYVPLGSTVPVRARRVLIIVSGILVAIPRRKP